jgi:ABC-type nitrate/sulfonate/bicarbonate transport system permease component
MTLSTLHDLGGIEPKADHQAECIDASIHRRQPAGRGRTAGTDHSGAYLGATGVLVLVALLELLPTVGVVDRRFVPPFSATMAALADRLQSPEFWTALGNTFATWTIGLSLALAAGTVVGVVIGSNSLLREATSSTIEFLRPIPSVALIPLAVMMFGTGRESTLLLVVYAAFWQILVQVIDGVQDVDPVARDTADSYRFSRWTTILRVVWPTTLPYAMTGFRLGATVALILTITGELVIGTPGLGRLVAVSQQSGQVASMYALVLVTGLLGMIVNVAARAVERRVLHWHPSVRQDAAS